MFSQFSLSGTLESIKLEHLNVFPQSFKPSLKNVKTFGSFLLFSIFSFLQNLFVL